MTRIPGAKVSLAPATRRSFSFALARSSELLRLPIAASSWENIWWHCFVASLGDGLIVWTIHAAGWIVFRRSDWFIAPQLKGYGVMLMTGLIIAVAVEWLAVHVLQRWTYTADMPVIAVITGVNIGLTPLLQMLILPPVIFYIVALGSKKELN